MSVTCELSGAQCTNGQDDPGRGAAREHARRDGAQGSAMNRGAGMADVSSQEWGRPLRGIALRQRPGGEAVVLGQGRADGALGQDLNNGSARDLRTTCDNAA